MGIKELIISLLFVLLVSCTPNPDGAMPENNSETYDYLNISILVDEYADCIDENKKLHDGIKAINNFYSNISDFDITTADKPVSLTICKEGEVGCSYFMYCDTNSMAPTFTCNDKLYAYKPDVDDVHAGDIIGFINREWSGHEDVRLFHRVIAINGTRYITKGDNNPFPDEYSPIYSDILFKVKTIEYR